MSNMSNVFPDYGLHSINSVESIVGENIGHIGPTETFCGRWECVSSKTELWLGRCTLFHSELYKQGKCSLIDRTLVGKRKTPALLKGQRDVEDSNPSQRVAPVRGFHLLDDAETLFYRHFSDKGNCSLFKTTPINIPGQQIAAAHAQQKLIKDVPRKLSPQERHAMRKEAKAKAKVVAEPEVEVVIVEEDGEPDPP
eukprot:6441960-Amphidinium_carterae.1